MAGQVHIIGGGGATKASIDQYFEYIRSLTPDVTQPSGIYTAVAWAFRCVQLRANAISAIPWTIVRGEAEQTWPLNMEQLWWQTEAALSCFGAAYWLKRSNRVRLVDLQSLNPLTMRVKTDPSKGIIGFEQVIKGRRTQYVPEEIVYFRYWHPDDDLGAGVAPMQVIGEAAGLAGNANAWAAQFFAHGAIPAVILTTDQNPSDAELERIRNAWDRLTAGVRRAFRTIVLRGGMHATIVGAPIKDLAMKELMTSVRQQIAVAFGVPESMVGDPASNYATARTNRLSFYQDTIIPEAVQLEAIVNEQLFEPMGLEFRFQPNLIEAIQQDEAEKADGVVKLFEAKIMTLDEARKQMGLSELTPAQREELQPSESEPPPPQEPAPPELAQPEPAGAQLTADFRKWRAKARKRGGMCDFESDHIPDGMAQMVKGMIDTVGVEAAFMFLRGVPEGMDSAEARLTERIARRLDAHINDIASAVVSGREPDYSRLQAGLQSDVQVELAQAVAEQALREAAIAGIDVDIVAVNTAALEWAREYSYSLITGIMDTTRGLVAEVVARFVETPGMTIGDVTALLAPAFGEVRAKMIAVTELTRAYARGSLIYQQLLQKYGLRMERVWQTSADERVCPICGPFNGESENEWGDEFPDGPPAHPRCRCWVNLRLVGRERRR